MHALTDAIDKQTTGSPELRLRLLPLAAAVGLCLAGSAPAATIIVNNAGAGSVVGSCTLLDAVAAVNTAVAVNACAAGDGSNDTIDLSGFSVPTTISFATAADGNSALVIAKAVTLTGTLSADGSPLVTVERSTISGTDFRLVSTSYDLTVNGLALRNGSSAGYGGAIQASGSANLTLANASVTGNSAYASGGGLYSDYGTITLTHSTLSGNTAGANGGGSYTNGGGAYSFHGSIVATDSTISGNTAGQSGGGFNAYYGSVTATNSTISGNTSGGSGGGVYAFTASTLTNTTISGNTAATVGGVAAFTTNLYFCTISANADRGGIAGGVYFVTAASSVASIITGNGANDVGAAAAAPAMTGDHNIIGTSSIGVPGDSVACDPKLGPLDFNGGATRTRGLLAGSCAIDAGPATAPNGITTDQRGLARPVGVKTDVGAFEKQGANDPDLIFANDFE